MTPEEQVEYFAASRRPWLTKKRLSVSEWADENRYLPPNSPFPGRWQTAKAFYQKAAMDTFSDHGTREIVLMWASQLGKGDVALNCMGWLICNQPSDCLFLQENDDHARDFARRRFDPMRELCPDLSDMIPDKKKRDGSNSEDHKSFPGGQLDFRGVQNPGKVKSLPIRYLLCDEVDDWPFNIGKMDKDSGQDKRQGDPLTLAVVRTRNFRHNKKILITSTPTNESSSRVWRRFQDSTQEHFYVPCPGPKCRHPQVMSFDRLDRDTLDHSCEECKGAFGQSIWYAQQRYGYWKAHAEHKRHRGFWLNVLYSPFASWEEINDQWTRAEELAAEGDENELKTFINSSKCELWYDKGGNCVKHDELWEKRLIYAHKVPDEVLMLTAAVDYQEGSKTTTEKAQLKYSIYGWGDKRTGWLIEAGTIWGGADDEKALARVDELVFDRVFERLEGGKINVERMFFDSGNLPDYVYRYCQRKQPRAFAIKGQAGSGRDIIKMSKASNFPLVLVGVDHVKDILQGKLRVEAGQPGSINFPKLDDDSPVAGADADFFRELTAEYRSPKFKNGYHFFIWEKNRHRDNDFGDCLVYAFAAMEMAGGLARLRDLAKKEKPVNSPKMGIIQTPPPGKEMEEPAKPFPTLTPQKPKPQPALANPLSPNQGFARMGRFQMPT